MSNSSMQTMSEQRPMHISEFAKYLDMISSGEMTKEELNKEFEEVYGYTVIEKEDGGKKYMLNKYEEKK